MTDELAGTSVLLSGGTGFLGAQVGARLVESGARLRVIAPHAGWREPMRTYLETGKARLLPLDPWWEPPAWDQRVDTSGTFDHFIHLAYEPPGGGGEPYQEEARRNVLGTLALIRAFEGRVAHVCFASSTKVYGALAREGVSEDTALMPESPYGVAKVSLEHKLSGLAEDGGPALTALRFSTLYGPGETVSRAIPSFIRAGLARMPAVIRGPGTELNDYLYVADAVEYVMAAVRQPSTRVGIFNAASGVGHSTVSVARRVAGHVGDYLGEEPVSPAHIAGSRGQDLVCDVSRAARTWGLPRTRSLAEGIAEEVKWIAESDPSRPR